MRAGAITGFVGAAASSSDMDPAKLTQAVLVSVGYFVAVLVRIILNVEHSVCDGLI